MTIMKLISDRYHRCHTREGGYPVFKTTFYDSINVEHLIRTLSNEWIRSFIYSFDRIDRINGIFSPAARYS